MTREDISFYAVIITAVVTVIMCALAAYEFLQGASDPERITFLSFIGGCSLLFSALLGWRARLGPRLLRLAVSVSELAIRFVLQNPLFLASLAAVCVLLYLLQRQIQDLLVAGIATGLVLGIVCMALAAVRLLAITRPSSLGLLVRVEERLGTPAVPKGLWHYDFIKHFNDPTTRKSYEKPEHIQVMQRALAVATVKPAIFQHPRAYGQTVLTYVVEQIPGHVGEVQLEFFTGILDKTHDETTGQEQVSGFHTVSGNKIEFEIWVSEGRVFREVRDEVGWSEFKRVPGLTPFSGALEVSFRTDAKGEPRWNWAVWGEPRLVEV